MLWFLGSYKREDSEIDLSLTVYPRTTIASMIKLKGICVKKRKDYNILFLYIVG